MNYHLITNDKFFRQYIDDIYELGLETDNIFWVRTGYDGALKFSTEHPIEYISDDFTLLVAKLKQLTAEDKLIVSWYTTSIGKAILESGITCPLYVCMMGGDFYDDPQGWHDKWIYDAKTYEKLREIGYIPSLFKRFCPTNDIIKIIKTPFHYLRMKFNLPILYQQKLRTISRIDYLLVSSIEATFLQTLYPTLRAEILPGIWNQNFDAAAIMPYHEPKINEIHILVGNSADPTNNYIDAFNYIKTNIRIEGKPYIHCFLSYAQSAGIDWIKEEGSRLFYDYFIPELNFMDRGKYMEYVNAIDVFIMYHNRQQAYGNIVTALVLGKPVFMKSSNIIYPQLKKLGIVPVYDVETISEIHIYDCIEEAKQKREETIKIFRKHFSKEVRLQNWLKVLK